jgi:hypothetical protein
MGVIVNAIPKSGTHLLCRLLELLGMGRDGTVYLAPRSGNPAELRLDADGLLAYVDEVPLAATRSTVLSRQRFTEMADYVGSAASHAYFEAHQLWSKAAADILEQRRIKLIIIMRDPRGVALSHAEWFVDPINEHDLRGLMLGTSLRERLACEFLGLGEGQDPGFSRLIPLLVRYRNMLPWRSYPYLYVTTFEALVGTTGGGTADEQLSEIQAIAEFVDRRLVDVGAVQRHLWGASPTFRNGAAMRWSEYLEEFPPAALRQIEEMLDVVRRMREGFVASPPSAT